jgi:hypothetical protein
MVKSAVEPGDATGIAIRASIREVGDIGQSPVYAGDDRGGSGYPTHQEDQMTTLLQGIVAGTLVALACGDSAKDTPPAQRADAPKTPVRGAGPADYCTLLTETEAEAIVGKALDPPQTKPGGDCWYLKEGGSDFGDVDLMLTVQSLGIRSKGQFAEMVAEQAEKMNAAVEKAGMKDGGFRAEPVPGVGDAAYYLDPSLLVLVGDRVLNIVAPRSQAVAVAAKALPRLKS